MSDSVSTLMLRILAQDEASAKLMQVGRSAETSGQRMQRFGKGAADVGRKMTLGLTLPIVGVGLASMKLAGDFESSMGQFRVASGVGGDSLKQFGDLAKKLGQDTQYSANEAAQAMVDLAKGGLKPAEIQAGALKSTMALAAAGGMDLSSAAVSMTAAMNTFGISGSQSVTVADALAGAANASAAEVSDLALGLQQSGQQAAASGLTLQETTAALAAFSDAGMKGSDAGTSLKTMLQRLAAPTTSAQATMKQLGMSFFDAQGKMKPLSSIAGQLQTHMKGLTQEQRLQALQTMFGSDATRAANVLFKQGADGINKYTDATSKAGNAQEMADARMSGWNGTFEQLKGSLETAGLSIGQVLIPVMSKLANGLKGVADWFSGLSDGTKGFIVDVVGVVAAIGPLLWGFGSMVRTMSSVSTGISGLARIFGLSTGATIADTAALDANTAAKVANGAAGAGVGKYPGAGMQSVMKGGAGAASGAGGLGFLGMGFVASLTAAIAAAVAATYVGTKVADHAGGGQVGSQSGATAGGTQQRGGSTWNLSDKKLAEDRINTQRILNDVVRSSVPNIDRQSQAYVKASKAAGLTDDSIKKSLETMKLTPRQIVTAFKANPEDLKTKLTASKRDLNGLKQSKVPSIRAEARTLNSQLQAARKNVNSIKQNDPTNLVARDLATARVHAIMNAIAALHDKDITITTTYRSYVSAASQSHGNLDRHGRAIGGVASGLTVVGERGAELVELPPGSQVFTHSDSLRMLGHDTAAKGKKKEPSAWQKQLAKWRKDRGEAKATALGGVSGWSSSILGFSSDPSAAGDVVATQNDLFSARRAVNQAGPNERRAAIEALTLAQNAYTDAVKRSNAAAVTSQNINKSLADKRAKVQRLASNLRRLSSMGLDIGLLRSLSEGDVDQALANTDAMVKGGRLSVYAANTDNNKTNKAKADIANLLAARATPKPHRKAAKAGGKKSRSMTVNLHIDGKKVHTSLLDLKKRQGKHAKLGLD